MTRIKLCGLTSTSDVEAAAKAGADYAGFIVHAPESHRDLPLDRARSLAQHAGEAGLKPVIVSATDDDEVLTQALDDGAPRVVQATGNVTREVLEGARSAVEVWRGLSLASGEAKSIERVEDALEVCDRVVLDALRDGYGGHGERVDWALARAVTEAVGARHVVLAGGLTPGNVAEAVGDVGPFCVDVSSGIETDGDNDAAKMDAFVRAARGAFA